MNIKAILEKFDKEVLSEEAATAIAEAFETAVNEKVESRTKLQVESAISKIDEDHASKLQKLLEAIDTDHTQKLEKVVDAITENHTEKLQQIASYYRKALNEKANEFSEKIINELSNYLDLYLDKVIPQAQLDEAVSNTYARKKLNAIREMVGVDQEFIDNSIKSSINEGKEKIDELNQKLNEAYKENEMLLEKIKIAETQNILEEKTKGMPSAKKDFIVKLLNDKDSSYVQENFNYVVEMFERGEEEASTELAEEAKQKAVSRDAKVIPSSVLTESSTQVDQESSNPINEYLSELKRK
jgi:hypothetical protein